MTKYKSTRSSNAVKGKTAGKTPVNANDCIVDLPTSIINYYKDAELSVDLLHLKRIPFIATVSKNIYYYCTIHTLDNMKIQALKEMNSEDCRNSISVCGFNVIIIHVDIQFKPLITQIVLQLSLNVVGKGGTCFS